MTPYYEDDGITIWHGDATEILPSIGGVDAVVTDPPYKLSQEYGTSVDSDNLAAVAGLYLTAPLMCSALVDGGMAGVFYDTRILPFGLDAFRRSGFRYMRNLTLYRRAGNAHALNGWMSTSDFVLLFSKPGRRPEFHGRLEHDTYVKAQLESESWGHPAQKPLSFVQSIVGNLTPPGGIVLDPYMGSGTTLRAAKDLGRKAIGVELEERFCEIAAKRLSQGVLDFGAAS